MEDLTGSTAIVTGGGGPNIGRAVCVDLANAGAHVVVLDVDADGAAQTVGDIRDAGGEADAFECDVSDPDAVADTVAAVAAEADGIDVLVNNAGGADGLTMPETTPEQFDANIDANLRSAFFTTQAALPHLREGDGGSVVFVSSINAILGGFSEVAYSTSKAGLHALARCLTADHAGDGVRFNVVAPGSVIGDSDTWQERERKDPGTLDRIDDLYPTGRSGKPKDIAAAITFLSSDRASWISGVTLPVDGGVTATGGLPGGRWWEQL